MEANMTDTMLKGRRVDKGNTLGGMEAIILALGKITR
jgi:hypothetical protein